MSDCDCAGCRGRRMLCGIADDEFGSRRDAMVSRYTRRFRMSYPEAIQALETEANLMWHAAIEAIEELHGLDDDKAASYLITHGVNQPEALQ
jgi:RecJ-like exonuclease